MGPQLLAGSFADVKGSANELHVLATTYITEIMLNPDILARILSSYDASQATIDTCVWMKRVSKQWHAVVEGMFVDKQWMHPFIQSGDSFVKKLHLMFLYEDDTEFREFLEQMRKHTWLEEVQYNGMFIMLQIILPDNSLTPYKLTTLHLSSTLPTTPCSCTNMYYVYSPSGWNCNMNSVGTTRNILGLFPKQASNRPFFSTTIRHRKICHLLLLCKSLTKCIAKPGSALAEATLLPEQLDDAVVRFLHTDFSEKYIRNANDFQIR